MEDNYYIDLKKISLSDYEKELENTELIPSRRIIQEDIKNRFLFLNKHGINNLNDILVLLKTPDKIKDFAKKTSLPEEYLTILKREIASSQPKPVNLSGFPGISKASIKNLVKLNIKNTRQLFDFIKNETGRKELSKKSGISYNEILELTKLTDVSRIKWVGANFARLLVDSKMDTVAKVSKADYKELYRILMDINKEKKYFKGKFGLNDMKLCVIAAGNVPDAIEY